MLKSSFITEIARGLRVAGLISGYIIGPMILLGAIGYAIDHYFGTGKIALVIALFISFISTNVLIIKNAGNLFEQFNKRYNSN
jgi:F0F1-type ATP synthase assembly protein I